MKKTIALLVVLSLSTYASASGIPVVDVAGMAARAVEHGATLQKWIEQAQAMTKQYDQLKATHTKLTGIRNLGDILDDPALNQYLPNDWNVSYRALKGAGLGGLARSALDIYQRNHVFDACASIQVTDMRKECEYKAVKVAQNAADADAVFSVITERLDQVRELQSRINTTEDPKAIAELSARIMTEHAMIANEQMRIDALRLVQESDDALQQQRQREFTARTFSATQGTQIQALTFP